MGVSVDDINALQRQLVIFFLLVRGCGRWIFDFHPGGSCGMF